MVAKEATFPACELWHPSRDEADHCAQPRGARWCEESMTDSPRWEKSKKWRYGQLRGEKPDSRQLGVGEAKQFRGEDAGDEPQRLDGFARREQ
ncbi:hypothetical protein PR202_ga22009 [Eleusine coracana subsp. coracana]|uniref:Uncharacterized protein n=1 Tax=Eleusine coracana subsp. coracana TaxID=191504 RepID=A0AAV5D2G7_ELECO|nr:hypothetical protein PR202_ga22009 [Eleusine coracana subsp. coracana]